MNTPEQTGPALYEEITLIGKVDGGEPVAIDQLERSAELLNAITKIAKVLSLTLLPNKGIAFFNERDSMHVTGIQHAEPCPVVVDASQPEQVIISYVGDGDSSTSDVIKDVLVERQKQIAKGYTAEHDEEHVTGEIAHVAASLCVFGSDLTVRDDCFSEFFGWGLAQKHGGDRRKQLVIAAALIVAEIQRPDRVMAANIETAQRMREEVQNEQH